MVTINILSSLYAAELSSCSKVHKLCYHGKKKSLLLSNAEVILLSNKTSTAARAGSCCLLARAWSSSRHTSWLWSSHEWEELPSLPGQLSS